MASVNMNSLTIRGISFHAVHACR